MGGEQNSYEQSPRADDLRRPVSVKMGSMALEN